MPYLDRLRTGRYQSPSGREFTFEFRQVSRSGDKKSAIHEAPDQDDAPVQDLGNAALRYPFEILFSGPDYDQVADAFFEALGEKGPGLLLHPRWGDIPVLPLSRTQTEGFVNGMRRAVFVVEFVRVPDVQFLASTGQAEGEISAQAQAAADEGAVDIGADIMPEDAAGAERVKGSLTESLADFKANMAQALSASQEIQDDFEAASREFEANLDTLILDPITLAQEWLSIIRTPARVVTSLTAKINGYGATISTLSGILLSTGSQTAEAANQFLQLFSFLLGTSESAIAGNITDREEAATLADTVRGLYDTVLTATESSEAVTGYVAPQSSLAQARNLIQITSDLLLQRSFSLQLQRRIVLARDRTPLDLSFEIYGDIERMDELIEQNKLGDDEIFMIPRGREIVYYA